MKIKIRAKDLDKNTPKSVRVNDEILKLIKDKGLTVQKIFDDKLDELFNVEVAITDKDE